MVGEFLTLLSAHGPLALQVGLISHEDFGYVAGAVLFDFVHPVLHTSERVAIRHVIRYDDAVRAPVVGRSDGPEAVLPSCVPDLQFDLFAVDLTIAKLEIDTDRRHETIGKCVVLFAKSATGQLLTA